MDPTQPLDVTVRIDSPHVVVYRLWFQRPGETDFTEFATGDDQSPNPASYSVGPLPRGSTVRYLMLIAGNPRTAYRIELGVEQRGAAVAQPVVLAAVTDDDGAASESGEVAL
jgi:hypothetical protein